MACGSRSVTCPDESFMVLYLAGRYCVLSCAAAARSLSQNLCRSVRPYDFLRGSGNYGWNVRWTVPRLDAHRYTSLIARITNATANAIHRLVLTGPLRQRPPRNSTLPVADFPELGFGVTLWKFHSVLRSSLSHPCIILTRLASSDTLLIRSALLLMSLSHSSRECARFRRQ